MRDEIEEAPAEYVGKTDLKRVEHRLLNEISRLCPGRICIISMKVALDHLRKSCSAIALPTKYQLDSPAVQARVW